MRHEDAWARLPDLLDDRDDPAVLAHVRACADCQRQLFLLGRVDRLLRDDAVAGGAARSRRPSLRAALAIAAVVAGVTATLLLLLLPRHPSGEKYVLRTASGRSVAVAVMRHGDARNASLALTGRGLPVSRGHTFVLWASADSASMQVGRFMVDQTGGCSVRFNVPRSHPWNHFWVTPPGSSAAVVAST